MKKIRLRNKITVFLVTSTILISPFFLTSCKSMPNEHATFIDKSNEDNNNENSKIFGIGEHTISKRINDPTENDSENTISGITQIDYHDGYKCVGLGISTAAQGKASTRFYDAIVIYTNEYEVNCNSTGLDANGKYVYSDFGIPIDYTKIDSKEVDDEKEFMPNTHIITVPINIDDTEELQFTYHDGYEIVDVALTGHNYQYNEGIVMYVNTEPVKCKLSKTDETGKNYYCDFGKPIQAEKTLKR